MKIDATEPQLLATSVVFSTSDNSNDDDPDLTSTNTLAKKPGGAIYFDFDTDERIEPQGECRWEPIECRESAHSDPSGMMEGDLHPECKCGCKCGFVFDGRI